MDQKSPSVISKKKRRLSQRSRKQAGVELCQTLVLVKVLKMLKYTTPCQQDSLAHRLGLYFKLCYLPLDLGGWMVGIIKLVVYFPEIVT